MRWPPLLELSGITKTFGGVAALRAVDFSLAAGEIHGLVGENGAGKSTLMKIIAGVHADYHGEMRLDGGRCASPRRETRAAPASAWCTRNSPWCRTLSVAENVHLGAQPMHRFGLVDWRGMRRGAREHLAQLGHRRRSARRDGRAAARVCSNWWKWRACCFPARASSFSTSRPRRLSPPEVERLFGVLRRLRDAGQSIDLHLAFSRRRAGDLRPRHGVSQRPSGRDRSVRACRQALGDRPDDRRRARGAGGKLPRRHPVAQPAGRAGGAEVDGPDAARARIDDVSLRVQRRRGAGHLWVPGSRAARAGANAVRQAAGRQRRDRRWTGARCGCVHDAGAAGGHRVRAGKPAA